jgi:hypothetical protein
MAFSVVKLSPNASGTLICDVASQRIQCCYEKLYEMLLKLGSLVVARQVYYNFGTPPGTCGSATPL